MKLRVIWSGFAEEQLDKIFEYYQIEANLNIAQRVLSNLVNATNILISSPYTGQIEEGLTDRKEGYRYLLHNNYKIIYSIDLTKGFVKIADVFDTRQNPAKITRNK